MERINYTEAQVTEMVTRYHAGETVEQIAEVLGKSVRSVVAKLSREGVYKAKTKTVPRTTKAMVIEMIECETCCDRGALVNLEKCDKPTLDALLAAIVNNR